VKKLDAFLHAALCRTCGLLIFSMMVITFSQVVARYAMQASLTWSEEVGRYIFVWIAFLGLPAAFRSGSHVALDILLKALRGTSRRTLEIVNGAFVVVLGAAILVAGLRLVELGAFQQSPALNLPMYAVFVVIPISGTLLLYFSLRALWEAIIARNKE
jgi:TRAP-type C4-dicarboxylate transport system permease small subunit